jgi:hypothetical protein
MVTSVDRIDQDTIPSPQSTPQGFPHELNRSIIPAPLNQYPKHAHPLLRARRRPQALGLERRQHVAPQRRHEHRRGHPRRQGLGQEGLAARVARAALREETHAGRGGDEGAVCVCVGGFG